MKKKVLIFSYYFPPYSGIGAVRMTSIVKHLSNFGWEPFIFTADWQENNCDKYDSQYGSELDSNVVYRAKRTTTTFGLANSRWKLGSRLDFLSTEMRNRQRWVSQGRRNLADIIKRHDGFDAIIGTYPAMQALTLSSWTGKQFKIPWIADFRDIVEETRGATLRIAKAIEKSATRSCSAITTVSEPLAETLRSRYSQPTVVIPNGFDISESEKQRLPPIRQEHFEITYTGFLYPPNHPAREGPELVFEALDQLAEQNLIRLEDFVVRFVGTPEAKTRAHFRGCNSESRAVIEDWLPRNQIRNVQTNATVLLCLGSRHVKGIMTGKIFDYLNTGRPILSIPDDDDGVGKLLDQMNAGETADNRDQVADYIHRLYRIWEENRYLPSIPYSEKIEKYNWRNQTRLFADQLDSLAAETH